jgi:hypothetical protein
MIDLRVRITVDLVRREVQPVQRQGFVYVRRGIRLFVEVLDLDNKTIGALRSASVDTDRLFSIDDSTTTEIDDCLSVQTLPDGRLRVGVHIAAPQTGDRVVVEISADRFMRPSSVSLTLTHASTSATVCALGSNCGPSPTIASEAYS